MGEGDEQSLAPSAHARLGAAFDDDVGQEVRHGVRVEFEFFAEAAGLTQQVGDVVVVLEAELGEDWAESPALHPAAGSRVIRGEDTGG